MSQYVVTSAQIMRNRLDAAFSQLLADAAGCSSYVLQNACGRIAIGDPLAALWRRWEELDRVPGAGRLLAIGAPDQAALAKNLTLETKQALTMGDAHQASGLARQAQAALHAAVSATVAGLRHDERTAGAIATTRALRGLGYHVSEAVGQRSTGLWAARGHEIIAVLVHDGGAMEIDNAGIGGGSCQTTMHALRDALAREGLDVHIQRRVDHGDEGGGSLIRRAGQTTATRPEAGLVEQHERGITTAAQDLTATANAASRLRATRRR